MIHYKCHLRILFITYILEATRRYHNRDELPCGDVYTEGVVLVISSMDLGTHDIYQFTSDMWGLYEYFWDALQESLDYVKTTYPNLFKTIKEVVFCTDTPENQQSEWAYVLNWIDTINKKGESWPYKVSVDDASHLGVLPETVYDTHLVVVLYNTPPRTAPGNEFYTTEWNASVNSYLACNTATSLLLSYEANKTIRTARSMTFPANLPHSTD